MGFGRGGAGGDAWKDRCLERWAMWWMEGWRVGGWMDGRTRWKKTGRRGGGITGRMASEWRAEEMAGPCSCKEGAWIGAGGEMG